MCTRLYFAMPNRAGTEVAQCSWLIMVRVLASLSLIIWMPSTIQTSPMSVMANRPISWLFKSFSSGVSPSRRRRLSTYMATMLRLSSEPKM